VGEKTKLSFPQFFSGNPELWIPAFAGMAIKGGNSMSKITVLTASHYTKLVKDVRKLIEEGKARATAAANQELVQAYWQVGKRISEEGLVENAGYGDAILEDLSDELGVDPSTLKRCIYFFQTYNRAPRGTNLSWTHYRSLLAINNDQERSWYEDLVETDGLNTTQLAKAIKNDRYAQSGQGQRKKSAAKLKRPAEPTYIYKAVVDRVIDGDIRQSAN